ncbi:MAG TPA: SMC-Scp complex subunit ScpB [Myxococcota bacterium]|nr:SMC-Scp complex subunit ScpB [Myxococcota bacterium]
MKSGELEAMIEALIFVSPEPITLDKIEEIINREQEFSRQEIKMALELLFKKWNDEERKIGRGLSLCKVAQGYVFVSAKEHAHLVQKVIEEKPTELTKAQVEVLAIVAYRQPITRVDIDDIRGVDSSFALKKLMQLKLLKILGKSEGLGRPILYGTTKDFLEFFSLNSLNDLPTLKQYEALGPSEEGMLDIDLKVSFKDLFADAKDESIISKDVERLSDEALKSLDEALIRVDGIK